MGRRADRICRRLSRDSTAESDKVGAAGSANVSGFLRMTALKKSPRSERGWRPDKKNADGGASFVADFTFCSPEVVELSDDEDVPAAAAKPDVVAPKVEVR